MRVLDNGFLRETEIVNYNELKRGDIIYWYGALLDIVDICHEKRVNPKTRKPDNCTYFMTSPHNSEAIAIIGGFYANGTYGGLDILTVERIKGD